jgi:hypothetical protein
MLEPNVVVEYLTFLLLTREVPSSNLVRTPAILSVFYFPQSLQANTGLEP